MATMKRRMSRSSRLASGRTVAATSSPPRARAASAMNRAPGIDPDPVPRQEHRQRALFRDPHPADEIRGDVGAEEHALHALTDQVRSKERPEEREPVDARPQP